MYCPDAALVALHKASIAFHAASIACQEHGKAPTGNDLTSCIDSAVCTEGAALACGFASNGSAHLLKHFRHVQKHFQSILPSLGNLLT